MPLWRCPHCGTPQAETSRCWVCKRSSTSCGTCRNFRRSIAGQLGYCGLDRRRLPLRGDELRGCWEAAPVGLDPLLAAPRRTTPAAFATDRPRLDFVPVGSPETSSPTKRSGSRAPASGPSGKPPQPDPSSGGFWSDDG